MNIKHNSRLTNVRVASTSESTLGILYVDNTPTGFVIEDEKRAVKVSGETRIPAGVYKLGIRKDLTPLTIRYQKKYPWFEYHIELLNVENFTNIYIHIGNTEADTAGCQIIGYNAGVNNNEFINSRSTELFKELYLKLYTLLKDGATIYYQIIDKDEF